MDIKIFGSIDCRNGTISASKNSRNGQIIYHICHPILTKVRKKGRLMEVSLIGDKCSSNTYAGDNYIAKLIHIN